MGSTALRCLFQLSFELYEEGKFPLPTVHNIIHNSPCIRIRIFANFLFSLLRVTPTVIKPVCLTKRVAKRNCCHVAL